MSRTYRAAASALAVPVVVLVAALTARAGGGVSSITSVELHEWLGYLASDELQGRAVFTEGFGLAAEYIADHLRAWGVKPAGDRGEYLQTVRVLGVRTTSHSTVTVTAGGQTKTFADGDGITFPRNMGGKRTLTVDRVEFVGYGVDAPAANHMDYRGKDVKGAAVVWLGGAGPKDVDQATYRRVLSGRNRYATEQVGAVAAIGPVSDGGGRGAARAGTAGGAGRAGEAPDFTTAQRLDTPRPPNVTAADAFLEFLFQRAPVAYSELKRLAAARDPLPSFRLDGVTLTFTVDPEYQVVRTQLTHNVVGIVEGTDARLKNTYVAFGAHYDHVGYADGEVIAGNDGSPRRAGAPGRVTPGSENDRIWNGADDDGSGTTALMAIARAYAEGARPRRSLLFVWHAGEERGLWGSRYFADYPTVPIDAIVAQLNIDMIGRNRDNKPTEANTVYLVGSDRISSELHAVNRAANAALPKPLTLNYEFNDPSDLEQLYFRSDHYSYAAKGVPIIFFTTGLHPDYHANTDDVSKIEFEKMTRITQMIYETGVRLANLDHPPQHDNQGPRAGRSTQ
jgi:peptidase M28-like protein